MNAIENFVVDQTLSKGLNNLNGVILMLGTTPPDESIQKEKGKQSTIYSNEDRSYESKEQTNEIQLESITERNKANSQDFLKKKRNRSAKDNILDLDYISHMILQKDYVRSTALQVKTKTSAMHQRIKDNNMLYGSKPRRRKQKFPSNKQCHICNSKAAYTELKSCSIKSCSLLFCYNCLIKYKENEDSQLENSIYNNNWKCLKCRNLCKCHRCRITHKKGDKSLLEHISAPKEPIDLKAIIKISDIANDPMRQMNNIIIDNFTICEISNDMESTNIDYYYDSNDIDDEQTKNALTKREKQKLSEIFQLCELYNIRQYSALIVKDKSNKSTICCIRCFLLDCNPNELLCFSSKKELMFYLKYCFIYQTKILRVNYNVFVKNKKDLLNINQNFFLSKWKFFQPKVICKSCFMCMLNMNNMVDNLKIIFNDNNIISLPIVLTVSNNEDNANGNKDHFEEKRAQRKYIKKKVLNSVSNGEVQKEDNATKQLKEVFEIKLNTKEYNSNVTIEDDTFNFIVKKNILHFSLDEELDLNKRNKSSNNGNNIKKLETNTIAGVKESFINTVKNTNPKTESKLTEEANGLLTTYISNSDLIDIMKNYYEIQHQITNFKALLKRTKQLIFIPNTYFTFEIDNEFNCLYATLDKLRSTIIENQEKALSMKNVLINDWQSHEKYHHKKKLIQQLNEIDIFCSNNIKETADCLTFMKQLHKQYNIELQANSWYYYLYRINQHQ